MAALTVVNRDDRAGYEARFVRGQEEGGLITPAHSSTLQNGRSRAKPRI
jgi:hypothetical protein